MPDVRGYAGSAMGAFPVAALIVALAAGCGGDRRRGSSDAGPIDGGPGFDAGADASVDASVDGGRDAGPPEPLGAGEWVRSWGGDYPAAEGRAVATDDAGNVYLAGSIAGTVDFGGGEVTASDAFDIVVVSFEPDGTFRWAQHYPGTDSQRVTAMDVAGDLVVVTGGLRGTTDLPDRTHTTLGSSDALVLALGTDGSFRWSRTFGGDGLDEPEDVSIAPDGTPWVVGQFLESFTLDGVPLDADFFGSTFIISLDPTDGSFTNVRALVKVREVSNVVATADGPILAGSFDGTVDFGSGDSVSTDSRDVWVLSQADDGTYRWMTLLSGSDDDRPRAFARDDAGNLWVAGEVRGDLTVGDTTLAAGEAPGDGFLARLGPDGTPEEAWLLGGTGGEYPADVLPRAGGTVLCTGSFFGELVLGSSEPILSRGEGDIFVTELGATDGEPAWARNFGGPTLSNVAAMAEGPSGSLYLVGTVYADVDFGGMVAADEHDGALLLLHLVID